MTLSPPVRVAALVGALVLTGLAAFVFLVGRGLLGGEAEVATTPPNTTAAQPKPATTPKPATQAQVPAQPKRVPSGFPAKVDHALRYSRVVVVNVSVPGAAVDRVVKNEARAAARTARAGFVALSTANERAMSSLVAKTGVIAAPAVVIVKRPGVVTATFSVTDAGTIAQAVAQSRR